MNEEKYLIKKYPNRRLYDTRSSHYITLKDVKNMIRTGEDILVQDVKTGRDLTRDIIVQILTEQESEESPLFTTEMLKQFIRIQSPEKRDLFTLFLQEHMQWHSDQPLPGRAQEGEDSIESKSFFPVGCCG